MPEFDELVERLAKAIHHEQYPLARERDEFWETERHQDMYFDFAKAALTALSETHVIVSKARGRGAMAKSSFCETATADEMKTLSVIQPWASLVALGVKRIETRSWTTIYRGPLAIHASKGFPKWAQDLCRCEPFYTTLLSAGFDHGHLKHPSRHLPLGQIVAVGDLVDVVRITNQPMKTVDIVTRHLGVPDVGRELAFGDYCSGRYMWLLKNIHALDKPIPAKGALGLWGFEMQDPRGEMNRE